MVKQTIIFRTKMETPKWQSKRHIRSNEIFRTIFQKTFLEVVILFSYKVIIRVIKVIKQNNHS